MCCSPTYIFVFFSFSQLLSSPSMWCFLRSPANVRGNLVFYELKVKSFEIRAWLFWWILCNVRLELWLQRMDLCQRNIFCKICLKKEFLGLKRTTEAAMHSCVIGQVTAACCCNRQCFCLLLLCENCLFIQKKAMIWLNWVITIISRVIQFGTLYIT